MPIKPLHDRVLIQRTEGKEKTESGIIIPEVAKEKPLEGTVVSCGDGKPLDTGGRSPMTVVAGDTVLFGKYAGTEVEHSGREYLILREDEILAVIT